jgi:glycine/D-amino acid oxidase-like deaminating enzyme
LHRALGGDGTPSALLPAGDARARFPLLDLVQFDTALWCPSEGVVDIHALLTLYLQLARDAGFPLITRCGAEALIVEGGCVKGVRTRCGDVRAEVVVDASGAWAGRLGRADDPLPILPMQRHLFVFGPPPGGNRSGPFTWMEEPAFYFRPEGDGLLFSPCDEMLVPPPDPPSDPPPDPRSAELLAEKLNVCAAPFLSLPLRRWWACLRTFAPDRRPYVGADADLPGLFHVSALGGFGVGASAAIGELAGDLLVGRTPDWIDPADVSPARGLAR